MANRGIQQLNLEEVNQAIRDLDDEIQRVEEALNQVRAGTRAFTGGVDLGGFRATNAGTSQSVTDLVTRGELSNLLDDLDEEDDSLGTSETEGRGGRRGRKRRTSRRRRDIDAAIQELLDDVFEGGVVFNPSGDHALKTDAQNLFWDFNALNLGIRPNGIPIAELDVRNNDAGGNGIVVRDAIGRKLSIWSNESGADLDLTKPWIAYGSGDGLTFATGSASGAFVIRSAGNFSFFDASASTPRFTITPTATSIFPTGSAATPSLNWIGDANSGLYRSAEDEIAVATGGAERLKITSTATSVSPVGSAATPSLILVNDTDTGLYQSAANEVAVAANGAERLKITATAIHVSNIGSAAAPSLVWSSDTTSGLFRSAANALSVATAGNERLRVTAAGHVLLQDSVVGTTDAATRLHLIDSTAGNPTFASTAPELVIQDNFNTGPDNSSVALALLAGNQGTARIVFGKTNETERASLIYDHSLDRISMQVAGFTTLVIHQPDRAVILNSSAADTILTGSEVATGGFIVRGNSVDNTGTVKFEDEIQLRTVFTDPAAGSNYIAARGPEGTFNATNNIAWIHNQLKPTVNFNETLSQSGFSFARIDANLTFASNDPRPEYIRTTGTLRVKKITVSPASLMAAQHILQATTAGDGLINARTFSDTSTAKADNSGVATILTGSMIPFHAEPVLSSINGANITHLFGWVGMFIKPQVTVDATSTLSFSVSDFAYISIDDVGGTRTAGYTLTLSKRIGVKITDFTNTLSSGTPETKISLESLGTGVEMDHAGPARFGATGSPQGGATLDVIGGHNVSRTATAGNYAVLTTDYIIGVTNTAAPRTITLPAVASVATGRVYHVNDESGGAAANNITVNTADAATVDGAAGGVVIATNYGSVSVYCDGTNWFTF